MDTAVAGDNRNHIRRSHYRRKSNADICAGRAAAAAAAACGIGRDATTIDGLIT